MLTVIKDFIVVLAWYQSILQLKTKVAYYPSIFQYIGTY